MKIEKLSKYNKAKIFISGFVICAALFITINLLTARSKYKVDDSIDLAEGTINYTIPDLKLMAIYIKDENGTFKEGTIQSNTTYQVVKDNTNNSSYCIDQTTGKKIDDVYMKFEDGKIDIKVDKKGTKCWVYLEKATLLNADILAKNPPKESTYNATYKNIAEFTGISTTDDGVYSMVDYDGEPTYYFRGAVTDNYVKFANFYWRIIRINSDGSIRMIYDGTSAHENGSAGGNGLDRQLEELSAYSTSKNDAKYVGLKYGGAKDEASTSYKNAHSNDTNSDILNVLEDWYKNNLLKYDNYLEKGAIFCNDRRSTDNYNEFWIEWLDAGAVNKQGYAGANKEISVFGPRTRRYSNNRGWLNPQYADLSCQPNDRFTPTDARSGNKAMKYLIGLIALDEVLMGGGFGGQANANYYLYTGQDYWTVSPSQFVSNGDVGVEQVKVDGNIGASDATYVEGVRPVINLKANTTFSKGDGSINLPYEVI